MCIFCKIAEGQIPSYKIYEDDMCLAFLDLSQSNIGHTLVVPKQHFDNILELDESNLTLTKFIAGEPMNPATNKFAGLL